MGRRSLFSMTRYWIQPEIISGLKPTVELRAAQSAVVSNAGRETSLSEDMVQPLGAARRPPGSNASGPMIGRVVQILAGTGKQGVGLEATRISVVRSDWSSRWLRLTIFLEGVHCFCRTISKDFKEKIVAPLPRGPRVRGPGRNRNRWHNIQPLAGGSRNCKEYNKLYSPLSASSSPCVPSSINCPSLSTTIRSAF